MLRSACFRARPEATFVSDPVRPSRTVLPSMMLALLLLFGRPAGAQSIAGAITGLACDSTGSPIPGAHVIVTGVALPGRRETESDARGRFFLPLLPVGNYEVRVGRMDFRGVAIHDVPVTLGAVADVGAITLATAAVAITGTEVRAPARVVGDHMVAGGRLDADAVRLLPNDRDYQSIVTLLPHATVSYAGDRANLAGTSGPESRYYVDGVDVVEPPGNSLSTSLPYNLVQAIEVRAGGYQAEFGGAGAGIVNAVTASGGDTLHGQLFGFFANRLLAVNANPTAAARAADFASWDAGGSVGGPIVRERLWYFAAYDPTRERQDIRVPGFGTQPDLFRAQRFAGKLTARLDDRTQAVLSMVGDPGTRDQIGGVVPTGYTSLGNLDPVLARQELGGLSGSARLSRVLGPRAWAELVGGLFRSRYRFEPRSARGTEPLYFDNGFVEGGLGSTTDRDAGRTSLRGALGYQTRAHRLKTGFVWEDESLHERLDQHQITRLSPSLWKDFTFAHRDSRAHLRAPAAYVQDAWEVSRALTLEGGLRWSRETWLASGGEIGQRVPNQWQPRVGGRWSPRGRGASLFATWGRFHEQTRLLFPSFYQQDVPETALVRIFTHDPRSDPTGGSVARALVFGHQPEVHDLRATMFEESQVGLEMNRGTWSGVIRVLRRAQREAIVAAISPATGQPIYGNPGRGALAAYPEIHREYRALEVSADGVVPADLHLGVSWVWSSLRGNDEGSWAQSAGANDAVGGAAFIPELATAAWNEGSLPNDRAHQVKVRAALPLAQRFSAGATLTWATGTPISELGSTLLPPPFYQFLQPRGSLGRTPDLYDLSLRGVFEPEMRWMAGWRPRVIADVYHVGSQRRVVVVDELHYLSESPGGVQQEPNPNYGRPLVLQPAAAYRLGLEVSF